MAATTEFWKHSPYWRNTFTSAGLRNVAPGRAPLNAHGIELLKKWIRARSGLRAILIIERQDGRNRALLQIMKDDLAYRAEVGQLRALRSRYPKPSLDRLLALFVSVS